MLEKIKMSCDYVATNSKYVSINYEKLDEYIKKLDELNTKEGYEFTVLAITDILKNGSYIIFTEKAKKVLENVYNEEDIKQGYFADGLVSRKKQILPAILENLD